jgi:hypothetical protein
LEKIMNTPQPTETTPLDRLYVVRLPEIHAVGHVVGAIVAAGFGQLADIQAKYSSLEIVPIDEYPEYIAEMIRSAVKPCYKTA